MGVLDSVYTIGWSPLRRPFDDDVTTETVSHESFQFGRTRRRDSARSLFGTLASRGIHTSAANKTGSSDGCPAVRRHRRTHVLHSCSAESARSIPNRLLKAIRLQNGLPRMEVSQTRRQRRIRSCCVSMSVPPSTPQAFRRGWMRCSINATPDNCRGRYCA